MTGSGRLWFAVPVAVIIMLVATLYFTTNQMLLQRDEISELQNRNFELESKISMQKELLKKAEAERADLQEKLRNLEEQILDLKTRVNDLQAKVTVLEGEKVRLREELESKLTPTTIIELDKEIAPISITNLDWVGQETSEEEGETITTFSLTGDVTNIGNVPLEKVIIIAVIYDGAKEFKLHWVTLKNLYVNEANSFTIPFEVTAIPTHMKITAISIVDVTPPVISDGKPTGITNDNTPMLSVKTDEPAICKGSIDADATYEAMTITFTSDVTKTYHTYQIPDEKALSEGEHTIYVKAKDEAGNINDVSYSWTFTIDTIPPEKVTGLTVTTVSNSQLNLSWDAVEDAHHYNVYRSTSSHADAPDLSSYELIASPTTNTYSDTGLMPSTTYYYRVTAVDKAGNEGNPSNEASGTTATTE
jgi:hypothetical protein